MSNDIEREVFVWPSDIDRAENDELNRVCEHAEQLHDELEAARAQQGEAKPVAWLCVRPDGDYWGAATDPETVEIWMRREHEGRTVQPLYTHPPTATGGVPEGFYEQLETLVISAFHGSDGDDQPMTTDACKEAIKKLMALLTATPSPEQGHSFQQRVQPWMMECFGPEISADTVERNHRFLEESLELVQSLGCTKDEALQLVDYVYGRPAGDPPQEVGGVMVTLAALCLAQKLDMHDCGETELSRIWTKVAQIRAKQAAKPKHSPLPQAVDPEQGQAAPGSGWIRCSERMPEIPKDAPSHAKKVHCLITTESGNVVEAVYNVNVYAKTEKGRAPRWEWQSRICPWRVYAWMPMPTGLKRPNPPAEGEA